MSYKSLTHFIDVLEAKGELVRIKRHVSPHLEISEITDRVVKSGGKALLFEQNGTEFPLLINAFGSEKRMCLSLGVNDLADFEKDMFRIMKELTMPRKGLLDKLKVLPALNELSSWMPKTVKGKGVCQEVVMKDPDLTKLPVLTCWPADGGPFITLPVVHTKDPITSIRNTGMYRMQVFEPRMTGMHWHMHKGSTRHFNLYKELGRKMPVTVTLGGDPAYTYVATAPLPENVDEYMLAGFLRKKKVKLVKCLTNDLEIPSDADFVIEGYVDPAEDLILEGPFGDHTGFYSLADYYPRFHVTCITHRKNAIYPATIVGIPPMEDGWIGKATERIFLGPIKMSSVPELLDMDMPVEGVFHNITLAKIEKSFPGQAMKVMNSLWGAGQMMFNKVLVILPATTDINNYREVAKIISDNTDPVSDIQFVKGPVDILDHSSHKFALGSKAGIDATPGMDGENMGAAFPPGLKEIRKDQIIKGYPEVYAINDSLISGGISLVILSVIKTRKNQIRELGTALLQQGMIRNVKFILFMDQETDVANIPDISWMAANNIDPERDCFYVTEGEVAYPCLLIDGTRKTFALDDFSRDWPNIIAMDDATIRKVDEAWPGYGLGPFIPSPSHRYKSLVINDGATVIPVK